MPCATAEGCVWWVSVCVCVKRHSSGCSAEKSLSWMRHHMSVIKGRQRDWGQDRHWEMMVQAWRGKEGEVRDWESDEGWWWWNDRLGVWMLRWLKAANRPPQRGGSHSGGRVSVCTAKALYTHTRRSELTPYFTQGHQILFRFTVTFVSNDPITNCQC